MTLLTRARAGDGEALEILLGRYRPRLERRARGRLPSWARNLADTHDLVQETLIQAFKKVEGFEIRSDGAFQAWLRQILLNRIRPGDPPASRRRSGGRTGFRRLKMITPHRSRPPLASKPLNVTSRRWLGSGRSYREVIIARVELGQSNDEIAAAFSKPSANAARIAV